MIERRKKPPGYIVRVYDPAVRRKAYVGTFQTVKEAKAAERQRAVEFTNAKRRPADLTIGAYAQEWLRLHHGHGTRRPAASTHTHNVGMLRPFLAEYGDRNLDGGVARRAALAWARAHPSNARVVSALYNDAIDDGLIDTNPFANRRQEQSRERKDIAPLTELEVNMLADIALDHWGDGYGLVARAWVLFGAWVGTRPGETFGVTAADLDHDAGEVKIKRVKKRGAERPTDTVVLPTIVSDAIWSMPTQLHGPIFRTRAGARMQKGALAWYWGPIRSAFRAKITPERWAELLGGQATFDFYLLRHFCASMIVANGGNEFDCAAQLGNSPEVCRATYVHQYRDERNARNRRFLDTAGGNVVDLRQVHRLRRARQRS